MTQAASRRVLSWGLASVTITTVYLFWPMVWGALSGDPQFFEWDVPDQYWGDLVYLCDALHDGELPYWNPYDRAGYPYYADPQAGLYHPLNWAICALAGPSPSLGWAHLRVVLGFVLCGVFGLLWLRRLRVPASGAIAGATLLMVAPFMRHNWELNLTTALAWLPAMLLGVERVLQRQRSEDAALLALAIAGNAWTGSPPALFFASSFTALYAGLRFGISWRRAPAPRHFATQVLGLAFLAAVLAALLVLPVFAPGLELASWSVQAGRSYASIADKALGYADLSALVFPQPGNHLYVGLVPLLLAPLALCGNADSPPRKGTARGLALLALLALLLALGDHTPVFRVAFDLVPGVRLFRLPHRYEAWLGPCAAALMAMGLCGLDELRARRRPGFAAWLSRPVVTALTVALLGLAGGLLFDAARGLACLLAASAVLLSAWRFDRLRDARVGVLLALLLALDLSAAMPAERHMRGGPPPGREELARRVLPHAPDTSHRWRYMDEFGIHGRSGTRLRRRDLRGYQDPLQLKGYERVVNALRESPGLAAQFNTRYALQGPHFIHGWNRHYLPPPEALRELPYAVARPELVTELTSAMPFAYWVPMDEVELAPDRPEALRRVRGVAPAAIAILDRAVGPPTGALPEGRAESSPSGPRPMAMAQAWAIHLERDELRFRIAPRGPGVVVVNEAWYPGWRASVDGEATPIFRANALVRAVVVGEGEHLIRMRFVPTDGQRGRLTLLLGWLAVLALFAGGVWRRSRRHA